MDCYSPTDDSKWAIYLFKLLIFFFLEMAVDMLVRGDAETHNTVGISYTPINKRVQKQKLSRIDRYTIASW
jgi:hypothetical protein